MAVLRYSHRKQHGSAVPLRSTKQAECCFMAQLLCNKCRVSMAKFLQHTFQNYGKPEFLLMGLIKNFFLKRQLDFKCF